VRRIPGIVSSLAYALASKVLTDGRHFIIELHCIVLPLDTGFSELYSVGADISHLLRRLTHLLFDIQFVASGRRSGERYWESYDLTGRRQGHCLQINSKASAWVRSRVAATRPQAVRKRVHQRHAIVQHPYRAPGGIGLAAISPDPKLSKSAGTLPVHGSARWDVAHRVASARPVH
jgi:hypothetical protein